MDFSCFSKCSKLLSDQYNTSSKVDTYGDKSVWHGDEQSHNLFAPNSNEASFIPYEGLRSIKICSI